MKEQFMRREFSYLVPFSHIPYGSKVVIYGGGKLGENYFRKIKVSNRAEIVAVIDSQSKKLPEIFGDVPLYEPDKICELYYDYVLIAVRNSKSVDEIKQILHDYKVPDQKIIWNKEQSYIEEEVVYEINKFFERSIESKKQRFFLFMLPESGNLGDYAIGYAEFAFFEQFFCQYNVYGVTISEWMAASEFYLNLIKPGDIIFMNGGGYLGDLWGDAKTYRHIVESFPQNTKIFFPNTLTYQEKPCEENKAFMEEIKWFQKQKNIFVFFRENFSYHLFRQYEKRCCLFPDMAFYLHKDKAEFNKKNKVLLCFRNDCEKIFNEKAKLKEKLKYENIEFDNYDIHVGKYISQQAGQKLLRYTIELFQSYDCIITDKLHGVILAIIGNIPCIAFDNRTHKISSVLASIKDIKYVRLVTEEEITHIDETISLLYENKLQCGFYKPPVDEYKKMANKIYEIMDSDSYYIGEDNGECG